MHFLDRLRQAARQNDSWLCVGLDPDPDRLPSHLQDDGDLHGSILAFHRAIIDATSDLVCAYKPNSAFYEALGPQGIQLLRDTCAAVPDDVPVILDAKRGDVGHTAARYAEFAFGVIGADAVTLSPYLGRDSLDPFLSHSDRGIFLLCRTSNPSAGDLQDLCCEDRPLYERVAKLALQWQTEAEASIGLVTGATYPDELSRVRQIVGDDTALLVPGVGAQSGDLRRAVRAAVNARGENAIVSASRSVLYASSDDDFADAARQAAQTLRDGIRQGGQPA